MKEIMTKDNKPSNPELALVVSPWNKEFLLYDSSPKRLQLSCI